jgi:hypothetical protein
VRALVHQHQRDLADEHGDLDDRVVPREEHVPGARGEVRVRDGDRDRGEHQGGIDGHGQRVEHRDAEPLSPDRPFHRGDVAGADELQVGQGRQQVGDVDLFAVIPGVPVGHRRGGTPDSSARISAASAAGSTT